MPPASDAWHSCPSSSAVLSPSGFEILVEQGAGDAASFPDAAYEEAGARVVDDVYGDADAVAKVQKPSEDEAGRLHDGQVLIGFLQPLTDPEGIARLAGRGVTGFAMEAIPRTTRAQSDGCALIASHGVRATRPR